jgi:hypothetical protein
MIVKSVRSSRIACVGWAAGLWVALYCSLLSLGSLHAPAMIASTCAGWSTSTSNHRTELRRDFRVTILCCSASATAYALRVRL